MIKIHQRLAVWQDAMTLVEQVYRLSSGFPADERFGLTAQLRRAAVSVPSNIAEGAARGSTPDFLRFLAFARGSLSEVETQILLARRLAFVGADEAIDTQIERVAAKLHGLIKSLRTKEQMTAERMTAVTPHIPRPTSYES